MDFYLDEQLPKRVANALHELERYEDKHNVYSTEMKFGKGVKDPDLYDKLKNVNGILISNDLRMKTRSNEFTLLKELGITAFLISLPSGSGYWIKVKTIINNWDEIKSTSEKCKHPFIRRIKMRGESEFL